MDTGSKMNSCTRRKPKERHAECKTCNETITNNRSKQCKKCRSAICTGCKIGRSDNDGDNETNIPINQIEYSGETNNETNRRRLDLKKSRLHREQKE